MINFNENPLMVSQKMLLDSMVRNGATPVSFTLLNGWGALSPDSISAVEDSGQIFIMGGVVRSSDSSGDFIKIESTSKTLSFNAMEFNIDEMKINSLDVSELTLSKSTPSQSILFSASFAKAPSINSEDAKFLSSFRIAFPEFDNAPDERVLFFYGQAKNSISAKWWRKLYDDGVLYLTAHLLYMRYGADGNSKPITAVKQETTSKTVGKLSKGMASLNSDKYAGAGDYASTVYGRRYWELSLLVQPTGMVVGK